MAGRIDRLIDDLAAEATDTLRLADARVAAGARTALAAILAVLAAFALHLDNPWWAGITGVVLVQKTATATWSRAVDRVLGTMLGASIGYLAAATISDHLAFELVCVAATAFTIYGQARAEHSYALLLGSVTVVLVLFGSLDTPGVALHLAVYRGLEIIVGVIVATAIDFTLAASLPLARPPQRPGIWSFPGDRDLAAVALAGGIAIALIPPIWDGLQLPGLGQTPITAFVILTALDGQPVRKAVARALGCLLGGVYGLAAMHVVGDAFLPWLALLGIGSFVSASFAHGESDMSYVGLQAGIAIILAMVQGPAASPDFLAILDRLAGIFGGILLVGLCHPILTPITRRLIALVESGTAGWAATRKRPSGEEAGAP